MYLEIVFSRDFNPTLFDGLNCRVSGKTVTARGTMDEINRIIETADKITGERTIIMRRGNNGESEKT